MALLGALCVGLNALGFTNRSLRAQVSQLLGVAYTVNQMSYDLARLRLNGLIERRPDTNTYDLTPDGQRVAIFYTKVHDRLRYPAATFAIASLHLVRGDPAVASSLIRRRLVCRPADPHRRPVARAARRGGDRSRRRESGTTRGRDLVDLGTSIGSELIAARGEWILGRVSDDVEAAITHLERALSTFRSVPCRWQAGRARLQLARALVAGEREAAIEEAQGALASFQALGAARDADEAAGFLRQHGVRAAPSGPRGLGILTRRELDVLALLGAGPVQP